MDTIDNFAGDRLPFWRDKPLRSIDDRIIIETEDAFFAAWRSAL